MNTPNTAQFQNEAGFRQALDTVIAAAVQEIRVFDEDLTCVQLEQKERVEALERFLAGDRDRRLRIVIHETDHAERNCPRLAGLIRRFSLAVEVRQSPDQLRHLQECFILSDRIQAAIRFHRDHARGKLILDAPEDVHSWWKRFEELWMLSTPCLSPTKLGL